MPAGSRVEIYSKKKENVEPKAPGQPGDLRPQGPRAGPVRSKQTLLRVRPARGDVHRHHRGQLRVHVVFWNAVSNIQHRQSDRPGCSRRHPHSLWFSSAFLFFFSFLGGGGWGGGVTRGHIVRTRIYAVPASLSPSPTESFSCSAFICIVVQV